MRAVLFCVNPYAFGILKPLHDELTQQQHEVLWFIPDTIRDQFRFPGTFSVTGAIQPLVDFNSDVLFVPGNEVPHYLRGVKVQVFHGLAGEKLGHFRVRNYFDLYLTQGPYFTNRFTKLAKKHNDFEVVETGWCKLDPLYQNHAAFHAERDAILARTGKKKLILYAPTFSPSLTSAKKLYPAIRQLAAEGDAYIMIKFHDLMDKEVINQYEGLTQQTANLEIVSDRNILKYLIMADLMISDTSSVVYEFILLNKPVITLRSASHQITWRNIQSASELLPAYRKEITEDSHQAARLQTIQQYHPYNDGRSSARMIAATEAYIQQHGVPQKRNINFYRRYKMNKLFGKSPA